MEKPGLAAGPSCLDFYCSGLGEIVGQERQGTGIREQGLALLAVSDLRGIYPGMIRKLKSGEYRLYSRKKDASTGKRRNLGTFSSLEKAKQHEREVQYFKRH